MEEYQIKSIYKREREQKMKKKNNMLKSSERRRARHWEQ